MSASRPGEALDALVDLMAVLRAECPWDRAQTHASLRRHLLEEAHEALDALDAVARLQVAEGTGQAPKPGEADLVWDDLAEELGDVLFQVVYHAHLAAEADHFDLAVVIDGIREKLVGRHPAIFVATGYEESSGDAGPAGASWERSKVSEKGRGSVMDGIPPTLPALLYASKVLGKAEVVAPETLDAVVDDAPLGDGSAIGDEPILDDEVALGRALLAMVARARGQGLDAEAALRSVTRDLESTVRRAERSVPGPQQP